MSFPEERHKGMKMFSNSNTLRGIVQDKINPNIPKTLFFFCYLLGMLPVFTRIRRGGLWRGFPGAASPEAVRAGLSAAGNAVWNRTIRPCG